jgi:hypothetical protein
LSDLTLDELILNEIVEGKNWAFQAAQLGGPQPPEL